MFPYSPSAVPQFINITAVLAASGNRTIMYTHDKLQSSSPQTIFYFYFFHSPLTLGLLCFAVVARSSKKLPQQPPRSFTQQRCRVVNAYNYSIQAVLVLLLVLPTANHPSIHPLPSYYEVLYTLLQSPSKRQPNPRQSKEFLSLSGLKVGIII